MQIQLYLHELYQQGISVQICWVPAHTGIRGNEIADTAAKKAISKPKSQIHLPLADWLPSLKHHMLSKWQSLWTAHSIDNKLRAIKPTISIWPSSFQQNRQNEVILTRLRIGHTRLTHGYLMTTPKGPVPECQICQVRQSIRHIFSDCPHYTHLRQIYFGTKTFTEVLSDSSTFSLTKILKFLGPYPRNCLRPMLVKSEIVLSLGSTI